MNVIHEKIVMSFFAALISISAVSSLQADPRAELVKRFVSELAKLSMETSSPASDALLFHGRSALEFALRGELASALRGSLFLSQLEKIIHSGDREQLSTFLRKDLNLYQQLSETGYLCETELRSLELLPMSEPSQSSPLSDPQSATELMTMAGEEESSLLQMSLPDAIAAGNLKIVAWLERKRINLLCAQEDFDAESSDVPGVKGYFDECQWTLHSAEELGVEEKVLNQAHETVHLLQMARGNLIQRMPTMPLTLLYELVANYEAGAKTLELAVAQQMQIEYEPDFEKFSGQREPTFDAVREIYHDPNSKQYRYYFNHTRRRYYIHWYGEYLREKYPPLSAVREWREMKTEDIRRLLLAKDFNTERFLENQADFAEWLAEKEKEIQGRGGWSPEKVADVAEQHAERIRQQVDFVLRSAKKMTPEEVQQISQALRSFDGQREAILYKLFHLRWSVRAQLKELLKHEEGLQERLKKGELVEDLLRKLQEVIEHYRSLAQRLRTLAKERWKGEPAELERSFSELKQEELSARFRYGLKKLSFSKEAD